MEAIRQPVIVRQQILAVSIDVRRARRDREHMPTENPATAKRGVQITSHVLLNQRPLLPPVFGTVVSDQGGVLRLAFDLNQLVERGECLFLARSNVIGLLVGRSVG